MTQDINSIKTRIEQLKTKKARAEGQKQSIEESWKRDFNISTLEEAEALKDKMEQELADVKADQEKYLMEADRLLTEAGV